MSKPQKSCEISSGFLKVLLLLLLSPGPWGNVRPCGCKQLSRKLQRYFRFQTNFQKSQELILSSRNFQVWGFIKPRSDPKQELDAVVKSETSRHILGPSCLYRALFHHNCHIHHFFPPAYRHTTSPLDTGSLLLGQCLGEEGKNYQKVCEGTTVLKDATVYRAPFHVRHLHITSHWLQNLLSSQHPMKQIGLFFFFYKLSRPPKVTQLEGGRG